MAALSCGGGEAQGPAVAADEPRDMLIYATGGDISNLLTPLAATVNDTDVAAYIYMPGVQSEFNCELTFTPGLVKAWTWSEDSTTLTLDLRDDITWADGTKVTADDVVFTYDLIADKQVASPRYNYSEEYAKLPFASSPTQVVFTWKTPGDRGSRLAQAAGFIVPKHLLLDAQRSSLRTHPLGTAPVSSGPFKLTDRKANQYFVLEPNEKFTGPAELKAKLRRVKFEIVPEYQTRLLKLRKGEIDLMEGIQIKDLAGLKKDRPDLAYHRRGLRFLDYVVWNTKDPRFQDREVRRALAHAVNIDAMIKKLLTDEQGEVFGQQATSSITPELCGFRADVAVIKEDLAKAAEILAAAGWKDTNGNGSVDKDGVELEFTLTTNRENERRMEAAQLVQADLARIGVKMTLDFVEFNSLSERMRKRDFQAALSGWSAALFVDPSTQWKSGDEHVYNYASYSNPRVDALIEQGLRTPNPADQAPIWKELQTIVYEDQPYLFLWWRDDVVAIDGRFQNAKPDILTLFHHLPSWEVPPDKVKYK